MSTPAIYRSPSFDPSKPDQVQIDVFGDERLRRDVDAPYSKEMLEFFASIAVGLSTQLNQEPAHDDTYRRVLHQKPGVTSSPLIIVGYSLYPEQHSLVSRRARAFAENIDRGTERLQPQGQPKRRYEYWENLFVQADSDRAIVERKIFRTPFFGKAVLHRAFKLASEIDLMAASGKMIDYAYRETALPIAIPASLELP